MSLPGRSEVQGQSSRGRPQVGLGTQVHLHRLRRQLPAQLPAEAHHTAALAPRRAVLLVPVLREGKPGRSSILAAHAHAHRRAAAPATVRPPLPPELAPEQTPADDSEPAFLCAECGQGFQRRARSRSAPAGARPGPEAPGGAPGDRFRTPRADRRPQAPTAARPSNAASSLKRHLRIHAKDKGHQCSECSSSLRPGPSAGPMCAASVARRPAQRAPGGPLARTRASGPSPARCAAAASVRAPAGSVTSGHTGEKPYGCPHCGKRSCGGPGSPATS